MNVFPSHPNSERPPGGRGAPAPSPLCSSPALAFLCAVAGAGLGRVGCAGSASSVPAPSSPAQRWQRCPWPPMHTCPPGPRQRGGGGRWASTRPGGPGPHIWTLRLSSPRPATVPTARLGPPPGAWGPPVPRLAQPGPSPGAHKSSPSLALPGRCTISGSPPPSRLRGDWAGWKQRRGSTGTKGLGGGGGGSPVGRALLPNHLLVRRQQLQAVAAEADAGHAAGRTEAERTDARTDGEGGRERGSRRAAAASEPLQRCEPSEPAAGGGEPAGGGRGALAPPGSLTPRARS